MKTPLKKSVNIEALLAKKDQISSKAINAALAKLEEQKQAEQEEKLLEHLSVVQDNTANAVACLRILRAKEKRAKAALQIIANAEQAFYQDANINKYFAAIQEARKLD